AMHAHAARAYPEECCGLMLGADDDGSQRRVVDVLEVANVKDEARTRRYLMAPAALLAAEKTASGRGLEVVGIYHSHPDHPSQPSEFDREHAMPFWSYLIVSCQRGAVASTQSWRLREDRSQFDEEDLVIQ
ncbi:MAG TPA: M67 family metallopeptidase, partial [Myxococcota bacterium]|nr:M67 family metallopeptidase [Myxococcota bacterium]